MSERGGPRGESWGGAHCSIHVRGYRSASRKHENGASREQRPPLTPRKPAGASPGILCAPTGGGQGYFHPEKPAFARGGFDFNIPYSRPKAPGPASKVVPQRLSLQPPRVQPSALTPPPCRTGDPPLGEDQQEGAREQVGSAPGGARFSQGQGQCQGRMSFCKALSRGGEPGVSLFRPILFTTALLGPLWWEGVRPGHPLPQGTPPPRELMGW